MIGITNKEFKQLTEYIRSRYGIRLGEEKRNLLTGRLHNVLLQNNFESFSEYYDHIISDKTGTAAFELIERITTNHTFFMREADHFHFFRERVLPYLAVKAKNRDLRIWSAGCSTGEEPYTLAMIMADYFGKDKAYWDSKILATDISARVLDTARAGEYLHEDIASLPPAWRINYFRKIHGENCAIADTIKNEVIFRRFNLMEQSFPFKKKFHAIFCRNVMIYFDSKTKNELINKFYDKTEPGGYLFIGHSESINREDTKYKYIMPAVYRKE